jgi:hypothetical protein
VTACPVTNLEPYLGAYGHMVALREGDLGYLHVHPEPHLAAGAVKFWLAAPSPGRYRLFFDFRWRERCARRSSRWRLPDRPEVCSVVETETGDGQQGL